MKAVYVRKSDLPAERLTESVEHGFGADGEHRSLRKGTECVVYAVMMTPRGSLYFVGDKDHRSSIRLRPRCSISSTRAPPGFGPCTCGCLDWRRDPSGFDEICRRRVAA